MSNLVVSTNVAGLNSHRSLKTVSEKAEKASEKLSSGYKINRAADDAAGLAISEKMRNQIKGLNQAQRNVADGISLIQIADAGMNEIAEMIKRQRELVIQGMNDTNLSEDRQKIHSEINQINDEITATAEKCKFNSIPLLTISERVISNPGSPSTPNPSGGSYVTAAPGIARVDSIDNTVTPALEITALSGTVQASPYAVGSVTIPAGNSFTVRITTLDPADSHYPDLNLRGPDGTQFGWPHSGSGAFNNTGYSHCSSLQYNGCFADDGVNGSGGEQFNVNGVNTPGPWNISFFSGVGVSFTVEIITPAINMNDPMPPSTTKGRYDPLWIQSGANENQGLFVDRYDCRASSLGIIDIVTEPFKKAEESLGKLDFALERVNSNRANAGAQQNRLEHTDKSLGISSENLSAAESRIRDTDMAKEMMEFTKSNIISQAGMAMLSQANQSPNQVLTLIK